MAPQIQSDNISTTDNSNKALFGPLGKYAITGVLMVSIIITTAIMLNKQIGTAADDVAAIEKEIAESKIIENTASTSITSANDANNKQLQKHAEDVNTTAAVVETGAIQITDVQTEETSRVVAMPAASSTTATDKVVPVIQQKTEQTVAPVQLATNEEENTDSVAESSTQAAQPQAAQQQLAEENHDQQWQDRMVARKLEQKQRLTEMFNRIKSRESEHLEQYKKQQEKQIKHLREQIARQQELIEELILRNKESYELREANMQHHQQGRERMLNRI